jgi:WD40 repeat protein
LRFAGEETSLDEGWRAEETLLGKPLVVVLDQVEEVFTHPDPSHPRELDDLVDALRTALGNRDCRPRGKLILAFRKEWLAELDRRLAEAKLPRTKVFLKQLDRRGIIEAIRGPARLGRLQRQYRLAVEDGLAEVIADNLLADAGSALAPTLQVLLTKMWERARQANPDRPHFDRTLYESLKAEGYLLEDVLAEGLQAIRHWNANVEASGLALDQLAFHTTDLGTAALHTRDELEARYAHRAEVLDGLLAQCRDHYLLIEAETPAGSTRLAHDLLAPLVQQRFRLSVAPGQRARRLLENRAPEWRDGKTGPVLDRADLATVEEGASGMRSWSADETRLVEASRRAEQQRMAEEEERARRLHEAEERQRQAEAEKQRATAERLKDQEEANRRLRGRAVALLVSLALTAGVAAFAISQWREANKQRDEATKETKIANDQTELANRAKDEADQKTKIAQEQTELANRATEKAKAAAEEARKQRRHAEQNLVIAKAGSLAAYSRDAFPERPQQCLILAVEAISTTQRHGEHPVPSARQALHDAVSSIQGSAIFQQAHKSEIMALALSADGHLARGCADGTVEVFDVKHPTSRPLILIRRGERIHALAFAPDGRLATASIDGVPRVWDLKRPTAEPLVLKEHGNAIYCLAVAPDGRLAVSSYDGMVRVWNLDRPSQPPIAVKQPRTLAMAFAPDGRLVTGGDKVRLWTLNKPAEKPFVLPTHGGNIDALAFARDGHLAIGTRDGKPRVWDPAQPTEEPTVLLANDNRRHGGRLSALASASNDRLVTTSFDGTARIWDLKHPTAEPVVLRGHDDEIRAVVCARDGRCFTGGRETALRVWNLNEPTDQPIVLAGQEYPITALTLAPDGRILTGMPNGSAQVWDLGRRTVSTVLAPHPTERSSALTFGPGDRLVMGSDQGHVRVWNLKRPASQPLLLEGHAAPIFSVSMAPDGRVAAGSLDGTARVWDLNRPSDQPVVLLTRPRVRSQNVIRAIAFVARDRLVTGSDDGFLRMWDLGHPTRPPIVLGKQEPFLSALALAPDGRIVSGGWDGTARVWKLERPADAPLVLAGHKGFIEALAFAPDGRLVTAGQDGTARVWNLERPTEAPLVIQGHQEEIRSLAFTRDGRLVTGGGDGSAKVWQIDLSILVKKAEHIAGRNLTLAEWQQFFGEERYRRTFPDLPDGDGVAEARQAQRGTRAPRAPTLPAGSR